MLEGDARSPVGPEAMDPAMPLGQERGPRAFRVRLMRFDRPQSRTLLVRAPGEAQARARAQAEAGYDWRIVDVRAD